MYIYPRFNLVFYNSSNLMLFIIFPLNVGSKILFHWFYILLFFQQKLVFSRFFSLFFLWVFLYVGEKRPSISCSKQSPSLRFCSILLTCFPSILSLSSLWILSLNWKTVCAYEETGLVWSCPWVISDCVD